MKKQLATALVLALAALVSACAHYNTFPKSRVGDINEPADLKKIIDRGQTVDSGDYRIVDVRPAKAYAAGHIPTASNLPNGKLKDAANPPPKDKFIILYCETGGRAQAAAKKLAKEGYTHLFNWGGFKDWPYPAEVGAAPEAAAPAGDAEGEAAAPAEGEAAPAAPAADEAAAPAEGEASPLD